MANRQRYLQASSVAWAYNSTTSAFKVLSLSASPDIIASAGAANFIGQYMPDAPLVAGRHGECAFQTFLRGSSVADLAPPEGVLLQACGMNAASSGSTPNVVWAFTGAPTANPHLATESPAGDTTPIDLTINIDRLKAQIDSCVGNAVFRFEAGTPPIIDFKFIGKVDSAVASGTLSPYAEAAHSTYVPGSTAVPFQNAGITFTPAGGSPDGTLQVASIIYDLGNMVERTQEGDGGFGEGQAAIVGYNPVITIEAYTDLIATFPWESYAVQRKQIDCAFTHNAGAGLREECDVAFGFVVIDVKRGSRNGRDTSIITGHQEVGGTPVPFSISWQAS